MTSKNDKEEPVRSEMTDVETLSTVSGMMQAEMEQLLQIASHTLAQSKIDVNTRTNISGNMSQAVAHLINGRNCVESVLQQLKALGQK